MLDSFTRTVGLLPVSVQDQPFLFRVYASTREDEMALLDWTPEFKTAFLRMQFDAQSRHYAQYYPNATHHIITREEVAIGRLIVNRSPDEILLMDIAVLPEHRNAGIGSSLIRALQSEGEQCGKPVRLHVENFNPALRLYERLGFKSIDESGIYIEMEWRKD